MLFYMGRRLLMMVPLLFGITLITFIVIHLAPGGPVEVETQMSTKISAQARENLKRLYGLDKPVHIQYLEWLKRFVKFDFGKSFVDGREVTDKILERIKITIVINILAMVLIFGVAIPIGVMSAVKQYSLFDKVSTVFVFVGYSTPSFWLALLLMIFFGVNMGVLPTKGLSERVVVLKHAFRNALLPIVTILGLMVPELIGGAVITETIFAIPGMGKLFIDSTYARDYPTVMGILVIGAALTLLGNLVADVSYALVDPRIRVKGKG
ncbi:MAG: ABC transporter permease [Nitrospirota bacterium]